MTPSLPMAAYATHYAHGVTCHVPLDARRSTKNAPTRWNVVFVSSRASDYAKGLSQFRRFGLPWPLYRTAPQMSASAEKVAVLRAFSGDTTRVEVITPLHYLLNELGEVRQIVHARMDLADPLRAAAFCAD